MSGALEDLDEELAALLIYEEHKRTGFIGLTEHDNKYLKGLFIKVNID